MAKKPDPPEATVDSAIKNVLDKLPDPTIDVKGGGVTIMPIMSAPDTDAAIVYGTAHVQIDYTKPEIADRETFDLSNQQRNADRLTVEAEARREIEMRQRPSLGRVVIYESDHQNGPYMAHVCFVHEDGMHVNLIVINHHGGASGIERVKYGTDPRCWHWPTRV